MNQSYGLAIWRWTRFCNFMHAGSAVSYQWTLWISAIFGPLIWLYWALCCIAISCLSQPILFKPEVTLPWWISVQRFHLRALLWHAGMQTLVFHQNANNIICNIQSNIIVVLIGRKKNVDGSTCPPHYSIILITMAVIKENKLCNDQCFVNKVDSFALIGCGTDMCGSFRWQEDTCLNLWALSE